MRAVVYARYSSDKQSDRSIEDQVRLCRERIAADGHTVTGVYSDHAISGATLLRPGMQAVIEDARRAKFDLIYAEALDRISRDQEDVAGFFKRMRHADVGIITPGEGAISELHVGLKGTMNALTISLVWHMLHDAQLAHRGHDDEDGRAVLSPRRPVVADASEQDVGQIKIGAPARVTFRAFPGEPYEGPVTFVLHELEMATRTAKVRIEVKNSDHRIKHEMFADVEIDAGANEAERLVVPVSALLDSGSRQVVLVERGEGRFEPRLVKPGARGDGFVEILEGVKEGEQVVVSANFLIDAESNLKAALSSFTADSPGKAPTSGEPIAAKPEPVR